VVHEERAGFVQPREDRLEVFRESFPLLLELDCQVEGSVVQNYPLFVRQAKRDVEQPHSNLKLGSGEELRRLRLLRR
jgi:hypothetical protein